MLGQDLIQNSVAIVLLLVTAVIVTVVIVNLITKKSIK